MPDIFRLSGRVDVEVGRAEANLRRVDSGARKTGQSARALAGDFDRASSAASMLGNKLSGLGSSLSVASGNLLSGAISKGIDALAGAMGDAIKTGLQYNKLLENSKVALESLGMSAGSVAEHLAELEKLALKTPFNFQELVKGTLTMNAFGFSMQSRIKDLTALSDAAAIAAAGNGKFAESFDGIVMALGQMSAKGHLSAQEMNQLAERGIPAWDILAKKVGITKAELMKLSEQGKISGKGASRLLIEGMGQFAAGTSERLSRTTQGLESNLADKAAKRAGEDYRESGGLRAYQESLKRGAEALDRRAGQESTQALASRGAKAVDAGSKIATDLATGDTSIREIGKALPQTIIDTVKEVTGIAKSGGAAIWQGLSEGFSGALESTKDATFGKVSNWAQGLIKSAKDTLGIKSPSTVFAEIGLDTARGFNLGLENGKKAVKSPVDVEEMKRKMREDLQKLAEDPAIQAMLATLRKAEGASYNTLFGGGKFEDFSGFPQWAGKRFQYKGKDGKMHTDISRAAGAYQFIPKTWNSVQGKLGLPDFSPQSQDLAAIHLMRQRGMLGPISKGNIAGALTAGNEEWASLPGSPYGQPTRKASTLIEFYNKALEAATGGLQQFAQQTKVAAKKTETYAANTPSNPYRSGDERYAFPLAGSQKPGGKIIQGGEVVTTITERMAELVPVAEGLDATLFSLSDDTALAKAALAGGAKGIDAVTKSMGDLSDFFAEGKEKIDRFGEAFGNMFDDIIEGRPWADIGKSLLKDISGAIIGNATGGKYNSPGGLLGGMLSGALGLNGGGSGGGVGGFATGGFSGGGGAGQYLGGGGGGKAGLFEKGLGLVGNLFGKGGAAKATGWGSFDAFTGATKAGGGLLGKLFGGGGGFLGKLFGGGAGAAGGGAGKGLMAALGFSNPFTAIATGAMFTIPLLMKAFGKDPLNDYKRHIASIYGVDVKEKGLLQSVMQLGQQRFGKDYQRKQVETVKLPEARESIWEYAQATGQKGNGKLFSAARITDPYSKENIQHRAMGGAVTAGKGYIWDEPETRGELFIAPSNGFIMNRGQAERALAGRSEGRGGGDSATLQRLEATISLLARKLSSMSADQVVTMAGDETVARKVATNYERRGAASERIRVLDKKR